MKGQKPFIVLHKRRAMTVARKARIWEARKGICYHCGEVTEMLGETVRYDHKRPLGLVGTDADENIWPVHAWCDKPKTAEDISLIAQAKRMSKCVGPRQPSKHPIRSRGFSKGASRPFPSRPFQRKP